MCTLFSEHGFWAHNMAQNHAGQPADIIVCKDNFPIIIDCKVCENDTFPISRIEPNQESAMSLWGMCGNSKAYFALKLSDGIIYMADFSVLMLLSKTKKSLNKSEIELFFPIFNEWMEGEEWK
mgnify:CR=1 FL=1